ncbi:MAG: histidinol-phosphate transaminase [Clostridiales bacterium]|nr:histidinol-phosphate transaminase [Clostridiales bacterium]
MSKYWNKKINQAQPYVAGEQPRPGQKVIKHNTNENPYPPSPAVRKVMDEFDTDDLRLYPNTGSDIVRDAVARVYGLRRENVFVGNGSDEVLALCWQTFFEKEYNTGKSVLVPDISYSFYPVFSSFYDVRFESIPLREGFTLDPDDYCGKDCCGIAFANPNAPTAKLISIEDIRKILDANPDVPVLVDEAYADFAEGYVSAASLIGEYKNLIVTMTLSKSYSLAGIRMGFAMGDEDLIEGLTMARDSFNSYPGDRVAQKVAEAALLDREYWEKTRQAIIRTRKWTSGKLRELGFELTDSQANFVWAKPPEQIDAQSLYNGLRSKGILIRYFNKPKISDYLRITIGTDDEMEALINAIREEL